MKRFALALALACVLSGSALAGDIHTGGAPVPGDVPSSTSNGEIPMVGLSAFLAILGLAF